MVRGAREYATVLMDLIFGVLLFVQSFILLTEVVYYSQFIVALFLVAAATGIIILRITHISGVRVQLEFYYRFCGRGITFALLGLLCYDGTAFGLAVMIIGWILGTIWAVLGFIAPEHDIAFSLLTTQE